MAARHADALEILAAVVEDRTGILLSSGRRFAAAMAQRDAATLGAEAVRLRMLPSESPEWQTLLEDLLVPETYLFRDGNQLALMLEAGFGPRIAAAAGSTHPSGETPDRTLRFWSAGCCTGEEAYSLAILALHALIAAGHGTESETAVRLAPGWRLDVLGTDIASGWIDRARLGSYATGELSSFRATSAEFLRYFPPSGPGPNASRRVRSDIGQHVRFACGNLIEHDPKARAAFDVVACRNALIYLSERARPAAMAALTEAVCPGGLLLLGPTDPPPDPARFRTIWGRGAMVHQRRGD